MEILEFFTATAALMSALFLAAGKDVKEEIKKKVSAWLSNDLPKENGVRFWASSFIGFLDDFLGRKMFSGKRILRSSLLSISFGLLFVLLQAVLFGGEENSVTVWGFIAESGAGGVWIALLFVLMLNVLTDFISIQESRFILGRIQTARPYMVIVLLLLDIIFTWLIIWLAIILAIVVSIMDENAVLNPLGFVSFQAHKVFWPFVATSFITSVWLYLYLLGAGIIKMQYSIRKAQVNFFGLFDVEEKPFTPLAVVTAVCIFLLGLFLSLIF